MIQCATFGLLTVYNIYIFAYLTYLKFEIEPEDAGVNVLSDRMTARRARTEFELINSSLSVSVSLHAR